MIRACLRQTGHEIVDFRPRTHWFADWEALLKRVATPDLVWVPCFRQRDVLAAARWARRKGVPLVFDPLISAWDKRVLEFGKVSAASSAAHRLLEQERRQFAAADRFVIAAPLWDLSFPAQLKVFLENIYVTGIVTKYSEAGKPVGLCRANELYYDTTSGGPFDGRIGYDYWKTIAQDCFGIPTVKLLEAENLDIVGADAEKIVDDAIKAYGLA